MYAPQPLEILGDIIRFAKKRPDPRAVAHFYNQLLNGVGEATGVKFPLKYLLPCRETEPVIDSFWLP